MGIGDNGKFRSGNIVLLRKSTMLHCTPMQMPGFAISKGKRKNKSASGAAQLVLTETLLHDVSFFTQERIFLKATIPELYGCMQNASAPADEVISTEDWLPSKRKEELLRCFWKRWKNFQNSSLMLYHIWDFQIHSWVENHFRLQAIWLTVSVAPSTQSFIYLGYQGVSLSFFLPQSLLPVEDFQLCDASIWLSVHIKYKLHGDGISARLCPFNPANSCILICIVE